MNVQNKLDEQSAHALLDTLSEAELAYQVNGLPHVRYLREKRNNGLPKAADIVIGMILGMGQQNANIFIGKFIDILNEN